MLPLIAGMFSPRRILYVAAALVLAFVVWKAVNFIDSKYAAEAEVVRLEATVVNLKQTLYVIEKTAAQKQAAEDVADAARAALDGLAEGYSDIKNTILSSKEEADGPISPILRDALLGLDGLRDSSAP